MEIRRQRLIPQDVREQEILAPEEIEVEAAAKKRTKDKKNQEKDKEKKEKGNST